MANSQWTVADKSLGTAPVLGASETDTPVSRTFALSASAATEALVMAVTVSDVTVTTAITLKLQTTLSEIGWVNAKTASITADGVVMLTLHAEKAGDQTYFPLLNNARLVISTGAGDAVTVDKVEVLGL